MSGDKSQEEEDEREDQGAQRDAQRDALRDRHVRALLRGQLLALVRLLRALRVQDQRAALHHLLHTHLEHAPLRLAELQPLRLLQVQQQLSCRIRPVVLLIVVVGWPRDV